MIVNLIRETETRVANEPSGGLPVHRVQASPFADAEAEVRRRVLRSLADRANPPSAVMFVRTWELPLPPEGDEEPATPAGDAPRKRQRGGVKR